MMGDALDGLELIVYKDSKNGGYEIKAIERGMGIYGREAEREINPMLALELANELVKRYGSMSEKELMDGVKESIESKIELDFGEFVGGRKPFEHKEFRKNLKRNWSFKCACCERKVSSATDKDYYVLQDDSIYNLGIPEGFMGSRACSEACEKSLIEQMKQIIRDKLYSEIGSNHAQ
ncbi:hypothetical protein NLX67_22395 [Domibacillus sp. A3M-37]|uniref:hypothetical protein n=1 Tax=Domibacillus sp. A3M-37 TaxID=2962037 RepID=UPI0020B7F2D7|nr:hypothetical protein [Domibacillus sp. A3M-37]MCP3765057.1 hypothetical protein [Domibacillus sp. A3M-37]